MAIREIIRMGHPVLRQKAHPVLDDEIKSPDLCRLVDDMIETLDDAGGIGLAAPQVNESVRVAILNMPEGANRYGNFEAIPLTVCINPKMTISAETQLEGYWEGCLSVPGLRGFVKRPQSLRLNYTDMDGAAQEIEFNGFHATVCQHELDHLDGLLFIDRIADSRLLVFEEEFLRFIQPQGVQELSD